MSKNRTIPCLPERQVVPTKVTHGEETKRNVEQRVHSAIQSSESTYV